VLVHIKRPEEFLNHFQCCIECGFHALSVHSNRF
jgi:hypothetical protein